MKKAAKVFIWIGMIVQSVLIFPIIVGILALKRINEASTKSELQTLGILTIFFCNIIGGIFMLCISENELKSNEVFTNDLDQHLKSEPTIGNKTKVFTQISMFVIGLLLFACLTVSIIASNKYSGSPYVPLIFTICLIVLYVINTILYIKNSQHLKPANIVIFSIFTLISVSLVALSIVTNNYLAYKYNVPGYAENIYFYGDAWEYWIIFGISCAIVILSLLVLILNSIKNKTNKGENYTTNSKLHASQIEKELQELKRLYYSSNISEQEYNKMRESIIRKYVN